MHDAAIMAAYHRKNRAHLQPWEPARGADFFTESFWEFRLQFWEEQHRIGTAAYFISVDESDLQVIATCSLTNVVGGAFKACNMGYSVSEDMQGKGAMTALLKHSIDIAFNDMGLHRIMANYMPRNTRSAAVLKRLGFVKEGLAKSYLLINDTWEDHVLTALVNPRDS